jgi:putative transposase
MKYDPPKHHRRSIRLKGYDYSTAGAYFITICTQNREILLEPQPVREMVQHWWDKLQEKFTDAQIDKFVIMPNHIHGIIFIVGADTRICPNNGQSHRIAPTNKGEHTGSPLHRIVQWFKTITTNAYIQGVRQNEWQSFPGKFWQRNYYEHIIRNEKELSRIRQYIEENPLRWQFDRENPDGNIDEYEKEFWDAIIP